MMGGWLERRTEEMAVRRVSLWPGCLHASQSSSTYVYGRIVKLNIEYLNAV